MDFFFDFPAGIESIIVSFNDLFFFTIICLKLQVQEILKRRCCLMVSNMGTTSVNQTIASQHRYIQYIMIC